MMVETREQFSAPFNGPIEIGLRALVVLNEAFPAAYSMQRLVISDYLLVHSDDVPQGPLGLHPQTPHRGAELLVRRGTLQEGLLLYESRGLIERHYKPSGVYFAATERSATFLDVLRTEYVVGLKQRVSWLVSNFGPLEDDVLEQMVRGHIGRWGAEFVVDSALWGEETP